MRTQDEFEEFAAAATARLYQAARLMCGDPYLAEDLVQEVLAKVYLAWGKRSIEAPHAYARSTLVRTFISMRRRRSATERPTAAFTDAASPQADWAVTMSLQAALATLKATDRAVLVARYFDDWSINAIADAIEKSPAATSRQVARALVKLRAALGPEFTLEGALS